MSDEQEEAAFLRECVSQSLGSAGLDPALAYDPAVTFIIPAMDADGNQILEDGDPVFTALVRIPKTA